MYSSKFGGRAGRSKKLNSSNAKKPKCPFCGAKGHSADNCPKKDSGTSIPVSPNVVSGAGSGISHKTSRKACNRAASSGDDNGVENNNDHSVILTPDDFNPYIVFDAGCDVGSSIDSLAIALKVPEKKCISTYKAALKTFTPSSLYGGAICRQYLKANKPWKRNSPRVITMMEADPNLFFVIGLGHAFLEGDDDDDEHDGYEDEREHAIDSLASALLEDDRVVGFCAKLDYSPDCLARTNASTQRRRLEATCRAAWQKGVPIQIQVAVSDTSDNSTEHGNELSKIAEKGLCALKDLAKILVAMTPENTSHLQNEHAPPPLQVHLSCWNGTTETMMKLLNAFPDSLYIGMNSSVGFAKASSVALECAFDVPLNRLLLETDNVIPAPVAKSMGRKAFSHSGLIPFIALAVSEAKRIVTPEQVARAAAENTIRLYGRGLAVRAAQAVLEAEARIKDKQVESDLEQILENGTEQETLCEDNQNGKVDQAERKQKKTKKKNQANFDTRREEVERDIDDAFLFSMLAEGNLEC